MTGTVQAPPNRGLRMDIIAPDIRGEAIPATIPDGQIASFLRMGSQKSIRGRGSREVTK